MHEFVFYCYGFASGFLIPFAIGFVAVQSGKRRKAALKSMPETGTDYSAYRAPEM